MRLVRLIMAVLLLAGLCLAQTETATLSGRITDTTGAVVPSAEVVLTNTDTGVATRTKTSADGLYVFTGVRPGRYHVSAGAAGFSVLIKKDLIFHVQDELAENFVLKVGSVNETVTVSADALKVNTETAAVGTVIDRKFIEGIPMNGRSLQSLIQLTPGVVAVPGASTGAQGEFSVNGQRTEANYYTVDGVSANVGNLNLFQVGQTAANTTLGTTQSLASLDALQEFRVNTSTYSAEFGRSPGAQIALTTRSGTNGLHGSVFDYFRNDVLDANNWFNNRAKLPKTAERQNDFGATLGGPVRIPGVYNGKDKTFFFFSYEGMRLAIPHPAFDSYVPSLCLRGTLSDCVAGEKPAAAPLLPLVTAYPLPTGRNRGDGSALLHLAYSTPSNLDAYSIRIDHDFGPKLRVFGRYADTPSNSFTRSSSNLAQASDSRGYVKVLTIGTTSLLTSRLANEFRFNYTNNHSESVNTQDSFGGATPLTLAEAMPGITPPKYTFFSSLFLFAPATMSNFLGYSANPANQWNVTDSMTSTFGAHTLKFGIDYRRQSALQGTQQLFDNFLYFTEASLQTNQVSSGGVLSSGEPARSYYTNFSAFAQDEWKATPRLSLSLGLRWDVNPPPTANRQIRAYSQVSDLTTTTLAPVGTPLYQTDHRGFAPRFGLAYRLSAKSGYETVVRGGFGVFYDTGSGNALFGYSLGYNTSATFSGVPFPLTPAQQTPPSPTALTAPYPSGVSAPDPNLKLPYTLQWNTAIEQQLGNSQKLSVSYVAAGGRKLLQSYTVNKPASNANFVANARLTLIQNRSTSDYNAMQVQYQRVLSHGLQGVASYTWAHAIDDLSSNGNFGNANGTAVPLRRGNADFDVRHSFTGALTYDIPGSYANPVAEAILKHWNVDLRQSARTALPLNVTRGFSTVTLPDGQRINVLPDLVPGVPLYLSDSTLPGGRKINAAAFKAPAGVVGNEPRNLVRAFGALQTDFSVQREFPIQERFKLQFRAEIFNIFNHPIFDGIDKNATSSTFGIAQTTLNNSLGGLNSLYQMGGPRSIQLALRLNF